LQNGVRQAQKKKGEIGSSFDSFLADQTNPRRPDQSRDEKTQPSQSRHGHPDANQPQGARHLLDPANTSVTLHILQRAALAVGRQLRLELI